MNPIASHITVFLQQFLSVERGASGNTCDSDLPPKKWTRG